MRGYFVVWRDIVDSTLWEEPEHVRVVFLTMMAEKDPDHVVRLPLRILVKRCNVSLEKVQDALEVLSSPDLKSITPQEYEGRRVREVEDGWLMLNGEKYQKALANLTARWRKSQAQRQRRERERLNGDREKGSNSTVAERQFSKAIQEGNDAEADRIAAMGLPSGKAEPPTFDGGQIGLPREPDPRP